MRCCTRLRPARAGLCRVFFAVDGADAGLADRTAHKLGIELGIYLLKLFGQRPADALAQRDWRVDFRPGIASQLDHRARKKSCGFCRRPRALRHLALVVHRRSGPSSLTQPLFQAGECLRIVGFFAVGFVARRQINQRQIRKLRSWHRAHIERLAMERPSFSQLEQIRFRRSAGGRSDTDIKRPHRHGLRRNRIGRHRNHKQSLALGFVRRNGQRWCGSSFSDRMRLVSACCCSSIAGPKGQRGFSLVGRAHDFAQLVDAQDYVSGLLAVFQIIGCAQTAWMISTASTLCFHSMRGLSPKRRSVRVTSAMAGMIGTDPVGVHVLRLLVLVHVGDEAGAGLFCSAFCTGGSQPRSLPLIPIAWLIQR